jgi:uncharacterized repeat protein (TIGR01451 family)
VAFEKIALSTDANEAVLTHLRIDRAGTAEDNHITAVKLYCDDNPANDTFETTDTLIGSNVFSEGQTVLELIPQTITTTAQTYFIVLDISNTIPHGRTIGIRCEDYTYFKVDAPDLVSEVNFPFASSLCEIAEPEAHIALEKGIDSISSPLPGDAPVPGATIQYYVRYQNDGTGPAGNLVITDQIPPHSTYVPESAAIETGLNGTITLSDDNGNSWHPEGSPELDQPITHLRWSFEGELSVGNEGRIRFSVYID